MIYRGMRVANHTLRARGGPVPSLIFYSSVTITLKLAVISNPSLAFTV